MSNKLEEILTNPDSTENFKDKFLGLILDFLEENNYDLNNLDQECEELICKIYDKNILSSVSGGVNNKLNLVKKAGALGLSALCAVSPAFGIGNQSDLKDQSTDVRKEQKIAKTKNQTKKHPWLNEVDKSTLLNIFGWGGFAFAGIGLVYNRIKLDKVNKLLENTDKNLKQRVTKLENEKGELTAKLKTFEDTYIKKDVIYSFEEDLKALTEVVSKNVPQINPNYCFASCYLFLLGLCIMKQTDDKPAILKALEYCSNNLKEKYAEAFADEELLLGKTNFEKYIQNAEYTHTSQLLYLVFGDTFDENREALNAISDTVNNGNVGLQIFDVKNDTSGLKIGSARSYGPIRPAIYLEYCFVASKNKTNFTGTELGFIDKTNLQQ